MLKKALFIVGVLIASFSAKAQTADEVYNTYLDFNLARLEGRTADAMELGETVMPNASKLNEHARTSFYYSMGNLYENDKQSAKALPLYEKVVAAAPNYYVGQRALAYMYGKRVDELSQQLNKSQGAEYKRLYDLYVVQVKKTLPHLEKAQSCDPTPETLALITSYYKFMKDDKGLKTLKARMADMAKNCEDLLSDK